MEQLLGSGSIQGQWENCKIVKIVKFVGYNRTYLIEVTSIQL